MNYNAEPDLDLNTTDMLWGNYAGEHNIQSIGNKVMSVPEMPASTQEFGKIMPMENAISAAAYKGADKVPYVPSFDVAAIHMDGDHISQATISEVDKLESKLDKDHNLSKFYDDVRTMGETNLEKSFNRKVS